MKKKKTSGKIANISLKNIGKFIEENKKELLYVGAGILGVIVIYKTYKGLNSAQEAVTEFFEVPDTDYIDPAIRPNQSNLTITNEKAVLLAKALLDACNKKVLGLGDTDELKIKEVFTQLKNGDDYRLVFNVFGKRPRLLLGSPEGWLDKKLAEDRDLNYWLKAELDPYWDREVYNIVKQRVESAGFVF